MIETSLVVDEWEVLVETLLVFDAVPFCFVTARYDGGGVLAPFRELTKSGRMRMKSIPRMLRNHLRVATNVGGGVVVPLEMLPLEELIVLAGVQNESENKSKNKKHSLVRVC